MLWATIFVSRRTLSPIASCHLAMLYYSSEPSIKVALSPLPSCLKIECDVCRELSQGLGLGAWNDLIIKDVMTKSYGEFQPDSMLMDPRNRKQKIHVTRPCDEGQNL